MRGGYGLDVPAGVPACLPTGWSTSSILHADHLTAQWRCRAHAFGVIFFSEPRGILGVAGTGMIGGGVLAVSLDKEGRSKDDASGHQAAATTSLEAKSSFELEPDGLIWAAVTGAQSAAGTACAVQLGSLEPVCLQRCR